VPLTPPELYARAGHRLTEAEPLPLHTVYMSAESISKALTELVNDPEEVLAIATAA
jgi:hypothetical protein